MAILQALIAFISKSAGKILNAIFGWAVHALFGKTTARDQTMLSAIVGAAVAWPLLVVGALAPKVAAFALTFVPLPKSVPSWIVRVVWLGLALMVPFLLGLALAARRPPQAQGESYAKRLLRGFPLTIGLAAAFVVMFVSVPVMRIVAAIKREKSADIPLVTNVEAYHEVAAHVVEALNRHGFGLQRAEPSWWVKAPTRILAFFGGDAFAGYVPAQIEHYVAPALSVSFYTSGVLLRGRDHRMTWAHGLVAETATHGNGLQTYTADAQAVERQIRRVWQVFDTAPASHKNSAPLLARLGDLARDLTRLDIDYDEWQVLYRQLLQVERAVEGRRQLLDDTSPVVATQPGEVRMGDNDERMESDQAAARELTDKTVRAAAPGQTTRAEASPAVGPPDALSTPALLKEITHQVERLVKTQIALAKTELRADLMGETKMVAGLGVSALAALVAVTLLFVTAIFALAQVMPGWAAGLVVSGVALVLAAVAGAFGWSKRVRRPLRRTRHQLEEDVNWTKERMA